MQCKHIFPSSWLLLITTCTHASTYLFKFCKANLNFFIWFWSVRASVAIWDWSLGLILYNCNLFRFIAVGEFVKKKRGVSRSWSPIKVQSATARSSISNLRLRKRIFIDFIHKLNEQVSDIWHLTFDIWHQNINRPYLNRYVLGSIIARVNLTQRKE